MADPLVNADTELSDAVRQTEFDILEQAFSDKPDEDEGPVAAQEPEPEKTADDKDEPARDEQGRFAKTAETAKASEPKEQKAETPTDQQQAAPEGEQKPEGKDDGENVPRWRLREIAEERRNALAERDALRAELIRLQTAQAVQKPVQQEQQQQDIDPLLDPAGFANKLRQEFGEQLRVERLNNNLANAHIRHGEAFEKAYEALLQQGQQGNRQLVNHLTSVANPGEAIVAWHKQQELVRETNGDINAFRQKMRDDLLKDPDFLKAAIEAVKAGAGGGQQTQQGQRPNNITRLPPSLSRATGTSANSGDPIDTDDSDSAVFDFAFK